jgi:hypothetical protein
MAKDKKPVHQIVMNGGKRNIIKECCLANMILIMLKTLKTRSKTVWGGRSRRSSLIMLRSMAILSQNSVLGWGQHGRFNYGE